MGPVYSDSDAKEASEDYSLDNVKTSEATEVGQEAYNRAVFEKRTMRSIDIRLLPLLSLLYAFSLVDRVNLSAARTAGMGAALNLTVGARYSIASCLYFVPYILLQLPGNLVLRRFGVRNCLSISVLGWGAVQLAMGFVPSWGYLVLCRILLGAFEAPYFPAMVFVVSTWYTRFEVQKRIAAFYLMSQTISGFSPILAYGLSTLDGKQGIAGWSWIFIIEGAITLFLGILALFFLPEFPDRNKFLSAEQTAFVLKRVEEDRGDSLPDKLTFRKVLTHLGDWTIWAYGIMYMCCTLPAYALAYFISIILQGMGYSTARALLLSAPPYGPSFVLAMLFSWLSDKYRHRSGFIAIQALICIVGLAMTAYAKHNAVRYLGTFLISAGNSGTIPGLLAYASNNVVSQSKKSVQSAITISFGGIGGIIASTVYREQDFPRYLPGLWVTIGSQILLLALLGVTTIHFRRLNRLVREGKRTSLEGQLGFLYTL